jgi:hypothetical protein
MSTRTAWRSVTVSLLVLALPWMSARAGDAPPFDTVFERRVLRLDLLFEGDRDSTRVSVVRLVEEPHLPFNTRRCIDPSELGSFQVQVHERVGGERGRLVYSRGFCPFFTEWKVSPLARTETRELEGSLRVPLPRTPVVISLHERDEENRFVEILAHEFEPGRSRVTRISSDLPVSILYRGGEEDRCVDLLFMSDGFTRREEKSYREAIESFTRALLEAEPFSRHRSRINVRSIFVPSKESGVDRPSERRARDTVFDLGFGALGVERYLMTEVDRKWRDIAAAAPYEIVCLIANTEEFGGGGLYDNYCTVSLSPGSHLVFLHEVGHLLAGLADEYVDTGSGFHEYYRLDREPWEPNLTVSSGADGLKWSRLLTPGIPVPTPSTSEFAGKVGLFEGGGYRTRGLYRPALDCMMRSGRGGFCAVCQEAIEAAIERAVGG